MNTKTKKKILSVLAAVLFIFTKGNIFSQQRTERPIVKDINASSGKGNRINVEWTIPETSGRITRIFVYRTEKPVGSFYELNGKEPLASLPPEKSNYIDTVDDYRDYYYTVICEADGTEFDIVLPSINATVNGTHIKLPEQTEEAKKSLSANEKLDSYPMENIRGTPLPYLDLIETQRKTPLKMSKESVAAAKELSLSRRAEKNPITEPYVFEEDLISPDSGDDFLLFEILRNTFIQKKYSESSRQLERLINTNRSKSVENRATFYLGESYYFSGDYKEAAKLFLSVYDEYPSLAKKWIDSSLDLYEIPEE